MTYRWQRVNKQHRCGVCDKPDYCTFSTELGLWCCMRQASDRPSKNSLGGWLHPMNGEIRHRAASVSTRPEPPIVNIPEILAGFSKTSSTSRVEALANQLGVAASALTAFGCLWASERGAWAIPERDGSGCPIGICLRYQDGSKKAVTGGHRGIYLPAVEKQSTVYISEGFSDAAAGVMIGIFAIGRPSCSGGIALIQDFIRRNRFSRAVIISDQDDPGLNGAKTLQEHLSIPSCIIVPPMKDLRESVKAGMDKPMIENMTKQLVWHQPQPISQGTIKRNNMA